MRTGLEKHIDLVLISAGLLVGLLVPILILQRATPWGLRAVDLIGLIVEQPLVGIPAVFLAIAGFTFASVGLNGLRGHYVDNQGRQEAIGSTAVLCSAVSGGAWVILFGLSQLSSLVEFRDVRIAATILGALGAYQLMSTFPSLGNDQTLGVFMGAGALLGYCAAPLFVLVALVGAFVLFGVPVLSKLLASHRIAKQARPIVNSPSPLGISSNDKQIGDLRQKIAWVKQSGVAPHLIDEEVSRLVTQIKKLGGTP